ncbi:hypothetical protein VSDG_09223 [Cytospora chrysosperma]|uniref:SRR1-like domain-containing protein n=1 Tax=Cytospora chrysosperma TaxID=252740 RepID=A0A423VBU2_CYTCH|nr:hypothetical protein VSDG_09223 [Valsa sordida]
MVSLELSVESQQEDSSQWTRIVRKGKKNNKKVSRQDETLRLPLGGPVENFRPNGTPLLSVDDIKANHAKVASKWHESECRTKLCHVIKTNAMSHTKITRAVCLGLGAFDPEDGSWVSQRRSHIQLAAFLAIVEILEEMTGLTIECFYQEPRFAQPDKDFVESLGGKVIDSPGAYDMTDESTLVFGVHLYRDIWAAALKKSLPAIFVGTGWGVWEEYPGAEKSPDFERIREMEATFDKFPFPQDDYSSFSSTCIYWKNNTVDGKLHETDT